MNASEARSEPQASGGGGHLATAVRIAPHDADARVSLGVVLATQGRLEEARAQYLEALRLDPSNQIARSNLDRISAESRSPP